jgi:hypothetical protein
VVAEAVQALSGARDTQLRAKALEVLTSVANNNEAARASMRDGNLIDTLVRLLLIPATLLLSLVLKPKRQVNLFE